MACMHINMYHFHIHIFCYSWQIYNGEKKNYDADLINAYCFRQLNLYTFSIKLFFFFFFLGAKNGRQVRYPRLPAGHILCLQLYTSEGTPTASIHCIIYLSKHLSINAKLFQASAPPQSFSSFWKSKIMASNLPSYKSSSQSTFYIFLSYFSL